MDEDRISGTARNVGGKIEQGVGRLTGDASARNHCSAKRTLMRF